MDATTTSQHLSIPGTRHSLRLMSEGAEQESPDFGWKYLLWVPAGAALGVIASFLAFGVAAFAPPTTHQGWFQVPTHMCAHTQICLS